MRELFRHNRHMEQLHIQIIKVWRFSPFALHAARPMSLESVFGFLFFSFFFVRQPSARGVIEYYFYEVFTQKTISSSLQQHDRLACSGRRASTRRSGSS